MVLYTWTVFLFFFICINGITKKQGKNTTKSTEKQSIEEKIT